MGVENDLYYPQEYNKIRIGTCYNSITGKLFYTKRGFLQKALVSKDQIISGNPAATIEFSSGIMNIEASSSSLHDHAVSGGFSGFGISIQAGFACAMSSSSQSKATEQVLTVRYVTSPFDVIFSEDGGQDIWFKCMTEGFRTKYLEIMDALKVKDYKKYGIALYELYRDYGDCFVNKVILQTGSFAVAKATYSASAESRSRAYSVTAEASGWGASISTAHKWGTSQKNAGSEGKVNMHNYDMVFGSPTSQYTKEIATKWSMEKIEEMQGINLPEPTSPPPALESPSLPAQPPKDPEITLPTTKDIKEGEQEDAARKVMINDYNTSLDKQWENDHGKPPSEEDKKSYTIKNWDGYCKKRSELIKTLPPKKIESQPPKACGNLPTLQETANSDIGISVAAASYDNPWHPYAVIGFTVKRWDSILPGLKWGGGSSLSLSSIYINKALIYILMRTQFVDYLRWIETFIAPNISLDYSNLNSSTCDSLGKMIDIFLQETFIQRELTDQSANQKSLGFYEMGYNRITQKFEHEFRQKMQVAQDILQCYDYFFENYFIFDEAGYGYTTIFETSDHAWYPNVSRGVRKNEKEEGSDTERSVHFVLDIDVEGGTFTRADKHFYPLSHLDCVVRTMPVINVDKLLLAHYNYGAEMAMVYGYEENTYTGGQQSFMGSVRTEKKGPRWYVWNVPLTHSGWDTFNCLTPSYFIPTKDSSIFRPVDQSDGPTYYSFYPGRSTNISPGMSPWGGPGRGYVVIDEQAMKEPLKKWEVKFAPVSHEDVGTQAALGLPMFRDLPFKRLKQSLTPSQTDTITLQSQGPAAEN